MKDIYNAIEDLLPEIYENLEHAEDMHNEKLSFFYEGYAAALQKALNVIINIANKH